MRRRAAHGRPLDGRRRHGGHRAASREAHLSRPVGDPRASTMRRWNQPFVISVNALGLTQITAWGTSFYCLGVLAKPIAAETGWAISTIFLGFSIALVVMGVISTTVGRLIDRIGARAVMSIGTVIVSAGLFGPSPMGTVAGY